MVGNPPLAQHLLELTRLCVHPVEDGEVGPRSGLRAVRSGGLDLVRNEFRLGLVIRRGEDADRIPLLAVAPEAFAPAVGVVQNQAIGHREDDVGAPVVLLKLNDLGVRKVSFKLQQVRSLGSTPSVDALVVITHHADIRPVAACQQTDQLELKGIRILKFIHHDMTVTGPPLITGLGMITEQCPRLEKEIVEVHRIERAQLVLILGKKTAQGRVRGLGFAHPEILGLADDGPCQLGIDRVLLVMDPRRQLLHQTDLVGLVEDAEVLLVSEEVSVLAEHPDA